MDALKITPHYTDRRHLFRSEETDVITQSIEVDTAKIEFKYRFGKRLIDILAAGCALICFLPVFLLIGIIIKLTSQGPIFFKQERVGRGGKKFQMYKFRTMTQNADSQKSHLSNSNEMSGPVFKIKNDPRVTKFGKLLRKFSIDELPQIWNILCGDMTIVGPRPGLESEILQYREWQKERLTIKPGLTCLWHVTNNRGNDFIEWARMDIRYLRNLSLTKDIFIILKTIPVVIFGKNQ